uniref:RxLR effector protein n=1 Tax=Spongospora subterranea TaxID=70186 RepID=A0A0H5QGN2_9EUKA|eukprot:CRZ00461.1 hypothetical protein [Spongospora subterranea]
MNSASLLIAAAMASFALSSSVHETCVSPSTTDHQELTDLNNKQQLFTDHGLQDKTAFAISDTSKNVEPMENSVSETAGPSLSQILNGITWYKIRDCITSFQNQAGYETMSYVEYSIFALKCLSQPSESLKESTSLEKSTNQKPLEVPEIWIPVAIWIFQSGNNELKREFLTAIEQIIPSEGPMIEEMMDQLIETFLPDPVKSFASLTISNEENQIPPNEVLPSDEVDGNDGSQVV